MDWRELLSSLQDKLTSDEKKYLAAHRLQDIFADETKFCDDPATARKLCRQIMYDQVLQAIQLTQKCPGVLTSVMYLSAYEYMSQNLRGLVSHVRVGSVVTTNGVATLPTETGKQLVFTLKRNGLPHLFRDIEGGWYTWSRPVALKPQNRSACFWAPLPDEERRQTHISLNTLEGCFKHKIQNFEDWPAFRSGCARSKTHARVRKYREAVKGCAKLLPELTEALTDSDRVFLERMHLDEYLAALTQANKDRPRLERYEIYNNSLTQLLKSAILFTQRVPGLLTTCIALTANQRIVNEEACVGARRGAFRWAYNTLSVLPKEPGVRLLFCLRFKGIPILFLGEDRKWYSMVRQLEPVVKAGRLVYKTRVGKYRVNLAKQTVDLCYRYGHDEYTTWKEIKKGGGLDELD